MKIIVRSFVIALALTGAVATTATSSAKATVTAAKTSAMPAPTCPPGTPGGCGIGQW